MGEFDYQRTVIGYHGCDEAVCRRVLLDGAMLEPSEKKYDWLGRGVYFWEYGPWRALRWAEERAKRKDGAVRTPAVVGAYIHLGRCFDLLDSRNTTLLSLLYPEFLKFLQSTGQEVPINERHPRETGDDRILRYLDCGMINWCLDRAAESGEVYHSVRGLFMEGEPSFPGSHIMARSHIQIAIRDPSCIIGYFRPALD